MDTSFFVNISITLLVLLIFVFFFKGKLSKHFAYPFELKSSLLCRKESSFLSALQQAVDDQTRIFAKVRIADVLNIRKGLTPNQRQMAFNHVSAQHFDFVLCKASDLSIIAAITLENPSHKRTPRIRHNKLIDGACAAAGLPLYRFNIHQNYSIETIREHLNAEQSH